MQRGGNLADKVALLNDIKKRGHWKTSGPLKVWERMPERPHRCGLRPIRSQVRNVIQQLQ
jgi:hypothetical protein